MPSRRIRLGKAARGLKMRSRDSLIRLRETKLRQMGIDGYRSLISIPVMLALILVIGWLRMPDVAKESYRPVDEASVRPLTGWALPADCIEDSARLNTTLVYAEVTWAELEPEKGKYDFESFEEKNHLDAWWAQGKRLILRFVIDRPGEKEHMDIPEWLVQEMGGEVLAGSFYETDQGCGFSPDYSSIIMREAHRKAIAALAKRYNEHPGVAYVELGSLGWNGEWSVPLDEEGVEKLPVSTVSREYAWHYTSSFTDTLMLMRRPYKEAELMEVGLYNSELGDFEATWDYLETIESGGYDHQIETDLIAMPDFYKTSPAGAHIGEEIDLELLLEERLPELARQISESHLDYIVLDSGLEGLSEQAVGRLEDMNLIIGYSMWIRSAEWDCSLRTGVRSKVKLSIRNDGVAALHAGWPVALALFDGDELLYCETTNLDTSMILPGNSELTTWIDIPDDMKVGVFRLKLAILDPATGQPGVRLMMRQCDRDTLWVDLGELRVIG